MNFFHPKRLFLLAVLILWLSSCSLPPFGQNNATGNSPRARKTIRTCTIKPDFSRKQRATTNIDTPPASPNQTQLEGRIICVVTVVSTDIGYEPAMKIYIAEAEISKTSKVEGLDNKLQGKEGQTVALYSKIEIPGAQAGKDIIARIEYRGDARDGNFWIIPDSLKFP